MKLWEILRFEFVYQARRARTWLYFAVVLVVAYLLTKNAIHDARNGGALANAPSVIALVTVICNVLWLLMGSAVAGESAARDAQTRMHPLIYTTPVSKAAYLGGRFLAALALNALILLMAPVGMLLALLVPRVESEVLGPFRPAAYISAYVLIALSTACAATAIQFSLAALSRRFVASYLGGVLLCVLSFAAGAVANVLKLWTLGELLDPTRFFTIGLLSRAWTPIERNTRPIALEGPVLASALVWIGVALGVLVFTYVRFRFGHPSAGHQRGARHDDVPVAAAGGAALVPLARAEPTFGLATHALQTLAIAKTSFRAIATSAAGFALLAPIALLVGLLAPEFMNLGGVPLLPRTAHVVDLLTAPVAGNPQFPWVLIPLLIVYYAGELAWRERDAGLNQIADATAAPEWVFFLGKFLGLSLILVMWTALLTTAGVLAQTRMGYFDFESELYLKVLFGLQLVDYLLFALFALAVHAVVNQKQVGCLVAVLAYGWIAFAPRLGIEHKLLVYASDPGWTYTDMRGFGASLGPWLWFKAYWAAWALLLAVAATLLWVRGTERSVWARLQTARDRFTRPAAAVAATAVALIVSAGGFIFYNTNVLHAYVTDADRMFHSAEYERRYGRYSRLPQPRLAATTLRVEIYPERRKAEVRGAYRLVNDGAVAIESIHLATSARVDTKLATTAHVGTKAISFDRVSTRVLDDEELGYRICNLEQPLRPGETLQLSFEVDFEPHGFSNDGADASVVANGTYFTNLNWLPAIGYQRNRELNDPAVRRQYGLPARPYVPSLDDAEARRIRVGGDPIAFEATVGTSVDQIAVAPGVLRRTWTEGERRYFHYVTDVAVNNQYGVFSAGYALHEEQWQPSTGGERTVAIQIFHHPTHAGNLGRMVASVRASLDLYTRLFGPYPYPYLRLIESPALGMRVRTDAATVEYGEGFSLLSPGDGPQDLDLVFAVVAHGVARGWWGMQVVPADVEGAGLLDRTLETYSAMRVVEETLGPEQLERYLHFMRVEGEARSRAVPPLLRAINSFAFSRRGPFALYALRECIGKQQVDEALRRLFEKHRLGTPPLPTSRDLYRELQTVTPDEFRSCCTTSLR
jgi:ABC-type transport system involved in multi-copper enzyme maturation permease subunit